MGSGKKTSLLWKLVLILSVATNSNWLWVSKLWHHVWEEGENNAGKETTEYIGVSLS